MGWIQRTFAKLSRQKLSHSNERLEGQSDHPDAQGSEFFQCTIIKSDGVCSDKNCPCPEVLVRRGTGYLYVSESLVENRRDCRTLKELEKKKARLQRQYKGSLVVFDQGMFGPILVCRQGAELRRLDLDVAAADARRWWETGLVPLRPTPLRG